jgi:TIGR03009 family protein
VPSIQRRPQPRAAGAPFQLTPEEQAQLDRVLQAWEARNSQIKTFECTFVRQTYGAQFVDPNKPPAPGQPNREEYGEIKYEAPDKGLFRITEPKSGEHWICDGKSICEFDHYKKRVTEYRLPPELQGQGIVDGPLPFLFGASAAKLQERYFLRLITPAEMAQEQIWMEAYPRYQKDAAEFRYARMILDLKQLQPTALQTFEPNGKTNHVYLLQSPKVNAWNPLEKIDTIGIFKQNPFRPSVPRGWTKVVEEAPAGEPSQQQAARPQQARVQ